VSKARSGIPLVEVVKPDGSKEFWVVASAHHQALDIVTGLISAGCTATISNQRIPISRALHGMSFGEARRVVGSSVSIKMATNPDPEPRS
jgi:hypothetical protein